MVGSVGGQGGKGLEPVHPPPCPVPALQDQEGRCCRGPQGPVTSAPLRQPRVLTGVRPEFLVLQWSAPMIAPLLIPEGHPHPEGGGPLRTHACAPRSSETPSVSHRDQTPGTGGQV